MIVSFKNVDVSLKIDDVVDQKSIYAKVRVPQSKL